MLFSRTRLRKNYGASISECCPLRIFRSMSYGKALDPNRTKLDDKNKKYVFISNNEKSKAYKLYDLIEKKLVVSRDAEMNEEVSWDCKK
jgi:hypothetical protein